MQTVTLVLLFWNPALWMCVCLCVCVGIERGRQLQGNCSLCTLSCTDVSSEDSVAAALTPPLTFLFWSFEENNFFWRAYTFVEAIEHAHLESRMRILAEGLEWSWAASGQRSWRRRFFFPRSERWKFCCWSSCVCRRGRTRWVPKILIHQP